MTPLPRVFRVAAWLVTRRLSPQWAEFVLGDLEEGFRLRVRASRLGAAVWLLRQALMYAIAAAPHYGSRVDPGDDRQVLRSPGHFLREWLRSLRGRPVLTAMCIVILAVGVGSATAVSSGVYALLYRPLPLPDSHRLVAGFALREGFDPFGTSLLEFSAFGARTRSFQQIGLARQHMPAVRTGSETIRVPGASVTANYLTTVGVQPISGRTISAVDDVPGGPGVALISHSFWVNQLTGRPEVVGSTLVIDGRPTTVVGIMPPGFDFPFGAQVWLPLQLSLEALPLNERLSSAYAFIARLRSGVPFDPANDDVAAIARSLAEEYPQRRGWTYRLIGLRQQLLGDIDGRSSRMIALIVTAVVFLLVICCVNVANLLLLRAAERERDEAVRLAIGASARQLALERFAEHVLTGLAGGVAGIAVAAWIAPRLAAVNPVRATSFSTLLTESRLDGAMVAIGSVIALAAAVAVGLAPRVRMVPSGGLAATLASAAPRAGLSRSHKTRLRVLVAAQVAIAVLLLVGGGLVLRSFDALRKADLGFRADGIVSVQLTLPNAYADHRHRSAELERLVDALRGIPGVTDVGITTNIPLQRISFDSFYTVEGGRVLIPDDVPVTAHRVVTPDYLSLLGLRLISGRLLDDRDTVDAPRVVVISDELAKQAWPGQDPIGRRIRRGRSTDTRPWLKVVGIVGNVKEDRFNFRTDRAVWYLPYAQEESSALPNLVVRGHGDMSTLGTALRAHVRDFDPDIAVSEPMLFTTQVAELLTTERFAAVFLSALALSGLLLAMLGLYGAVAQIVTAQRGEIALRLAVGAPRGQIVRMVVREVTLVAVGGAAVGALVASASANGLQHILYQVEPHDGATYAGVTLILIVASAVAGFFPAWRAVRVNPAGLLR
jgi:putative ABC transport system permease protein